MIQYFHPYKVGDKVEVKYPYHKELYGKVGVVTYVWVDGCTVFGNRYHNDWLTLKALEMFDL